jgi:ribosomal protein S12 methylthiotransferase accessory factor
MTALVAGICDVVQRYVAVKTLSDEDLELPEIPRQAVQHLASFEPVAALGLGPMQVVVKDCTLGGRLPVLALILLDKETGEYTVCHGAAATLQGAVARCVERWNVKQGEVLAREQDRPTAPYSVLLGEDDWLSSRSSGSISDHLGLSIFRPRGESRHPSAFLEGPSKTRDELKFLVELLEKGGHRLLVRDLSFLGLPSTLVYIPGLSDLGTAADPMETARQRGAAQKTLLSLKGSPSDAFRECAQRLESLAEKAPTKRARLARETMSIAVAPEADFSQLLDTDFLLAELYRGAREPGRAAACLERHLSSLSETERDEVEHWDYYWSSWAYLELWSRGLPESEITAALTSLYGEGRAWELAEDIGQPENAFGYYATPKCGDCAPCSIQEHCLYERWKAVAEGLKAQMERALPRQLALSSLFSTK